MKKERKSFYILVISLLLLMILTISLAMLLERNPAIHRRALVSRLSNQELPLEESLQQAQNYIQQDELNNAEVILLALVEKYPEESEPRLLLGSLYLLQKRYSHAEQIFRQYILYYPENANAYQLLSSAQVKLGSFADAKNNILKASELAPQESSILLQAADLHAMLKENEKALNFLIKALSINNDTSQLKNYPNIIKLQESAEFKAYFQ